MRLRSIVIVPFVWSALVFAQIPTAKPPQAPPAPKPYSSPLGFSYSVPSDWEIVDTSAALPALQQQAAKHGASDAEKRGLSCVQMALTAKHGAPPSVIVEVALPFDCFGEKLTEKDLPGFARGAEEGITNSFDLSGQTSNTYALGVHSLWIERSDGSIKGRADTHYTIETVCTLLSKAAACWMTLAADKDALATFESGAVKLDGDAQPALVPATAFDKKP